MAAALFTSRYYTSPDGLKLHFRDYLGPADPRFAVLCLPGLTRNARDFEDLAPHLARDYRVICADLRGRGLSAYAPDPTTYVAPVYVRDIGALLKAADVRDVAVIGTSLGGIIAMIMATVMPSRLLGVVLNDIGPELDPKGLARIASYAGKTKSVRTWDEAGTVVEALDRQIFPEYQAADWQRIARRRFAQSPDGALKPDYDPNISRPFASSAAAVDLWPFFKRLKPVPTLAVRGETSDILAPDVCARMKEAVPHLRQVTVPNRGHAPYLDEPAALSAIDEFLAALPRRVGIVTRTRRALSGAIFVTRLKLKGAA